MAVLASMVAGAMVLSSFVVPEKNSADVCAKLKIDPIYEGAAYCLDCGGIVYVYLYIYKEVGRRDSYYALDIKGNRYPVKENPNYMKDTRRRDNDYKYYIYIKKEGSNFYFNIYPGSKD